MALDLTLSPLYRINGQEADSMPGLLAMNPPRKTARGREQDRLIIYLLLMGNATFTSAEYMQIATNAAGVFYQTPGSLTSALRASAELINRVLHERNMTGGAGGQYVTGWLTLAALREQQCTFLLSGPMHIYWLGREAQHIHEPGLTGKGLGLNQTAAIHYSQAALQAGDRLVMCGKTPSAWNTTLAEATPASLDITRHRLITLTSEDLNAVVIQAADGTGNLTLLKGMTELKAAPASQSASLLTPPPSLPRREVAESQPEVDSTFPPAHFVQPSAYALPPQPQEEIPPELTPSINPASIIARKNAPRAFPSSIPRTRSQGQKPEAPAEKTVPPIKEESQPKAPRESSERTRQAAKAIAGGMQNVRRARRNASAGIQKILPRILPGRDTGNAFRISTPTLVFIAILIPLMVVAAAFTVYFKYGYSLQYESYFKQANDFRIQAANLTDPVEQRKNWDNVLLNVERAEDFRKTGETNALRQEAEAHLDQLLGRLRLQFTPAFSNNLGIEVSRMAASDTDLFLLDAASGEALHAQLTNGHGFQMDTAFNCAPGVYGGYTVGPLVDIMALPGLNSINATLLGIDAGGNLLYCAPGQVAQAIPLPPPDTNWGRVTAFTLDAGNLYVLDAQSRAVWVYTGTDGAFIDRPYFFFGSQTPEKQDVIDLTVTGDELFMLHADGHLSKCSYSRIESVPTRCVDPSPLVNPFKAYQDTDLFGSAHITQMTFTAPPDQSILLLSADNQSVFRLTPRSLELQNQMLPTTGSSNPVQTGAVGAMAVGPNHVLYLAVKGQVYFTTGMP